jgi:hypothetical protein
MKTLPEALQRALALLGHFGFLTTRELAQLNWAHMKPASAIVTSQNACKRLEDASLVVKKALPLDKLQSVYVLGSKGAAYLNEAYFDMWMDHEPVGVQQWFADGYNLSLNSHVTRRPLIALLYAAIVETLDTIQTADVAAALDASGKGQRLAPTLHAVGQRSLARGFLGLKRYDHFDAMLLDDEGTPKFGVYLAHSGTPQAAISVCKLAHSPEAFLIASDKPTQLASLIRWREKVNPTMHSYLANALPIGLVGKA